jgi:hypothetical protein
MNIAIQFFGHLRTFERTSTSFLKNVVEVNKAEGHNVDIFIHTWDELDHSTVNYRNPDGECLADHKMLPEDIELAREIYKPKAFEIEAQLVCEEVIIREKIGLRFERSIKGCLNMAYSLYRSSQLRNKYEKLEGKKYDWVIVTRPDILFHNKLSIDRIFDAHRQSELETPKKCIFHGFNPFGRGNMIEEPQFITGSDLVFFARPEDIDLANSLYEVFDANIDVHDFHCMEAWFAYFWRKQGLDVYPMNFRHGPDFDVIKSHVQNIDGMQSKKNKDHKYYMRLFRKHLYSVLPYILVKSPIKNLKFKLKAYK